jgi:hypothetical protein
MENIVFLIITLVICYIGISHLIRNIWMYKDEWKLKKYIEENPKWAFLRNKYWVDKAVKITKKYFLPLWTFMSILFIWGWIYLLIIFFSL